MATQVRIGRRQRIFAVTKLKTLSTHSERFRVKSWQKEGFELHPAPDFRAGDAVQKLDGFRAIVKCQKAVRVVDYWARLVSEHGLIIKNQFDPLELHDLLPSIYLEEFDTATQQSKIRLEGAYLRDLWGSGVVGKTVDQQVTGSVNALWKEADQLNFRDGRAVFSIYHLEFREKDFIWVNDLTLPMFDEKGGKFSLGYIWRSSNKT